MARALGRSSAHVATLVRQETGRTAREWILECRMAEARRRLRGTDERVDIIAERVGYADVTQLHPPVPPRPRGHPVRVEAPGDGGALK